MTSTAATFIASQDAPNATTTAYTSPTAGKGSRIDYFVCTNHSAGTVNVSIWSVPFGGTAADSNLRVKAQALAAGESRVMFELLGERLAPGDFLAWSASAATSINGKASGVELT
jgi:hypothetical protein